MIKKLIPYLIGPAVVLLLLGGSRAIRAIASASEESPAEAVESWNQAFADGDLEEFCGYLLPRDERDYADALGATSADCQNWAPQLYDVTGEKTLEAAGIVTAKELERNIDGMPVVRSSDGELLLMAKRDGDWRISLAVSSGRVLGRKPKLSPGDKRV